MIITNIGLLTGLDPEKRPYRRGREMDETGSLANAWLRVTDGKFDTWGSAGTEPPVREKTVDAGGGIVMPAFCDSHTHLVYAGCRDGEFIDKIHGLSYEEIARRGGGILNSARLLAKTSEQELYEQSLERAREVMLKGTGCIEIKSGYGLTLESELKMLRVIARIAESVPMEVCSTFLGAHAVGLEYAGRQSEYVDHICRDMIPAVAAEGLAEFVDVFCDKGFFTVEETDRILTAADAYGMKPKIHANELDVSGGVEVGVSRSALSVDHLERAGEAQLRLLSESETVATMLPGASFFLGMPYGKAREAIDAGTILALASDYNPGSSPSGDMRMVGALGCIRMRLTPEQALNATTLNGAFAMRRSADYGSIAQGKTASFIITRPLPSLAFPYYAYTTPYISKIFMRGIEQA